MGKSGLRSALALLLFGANTMLATTALAQPITEAEVPPALRPWIPWALDAYPLYGCTPRESAAPTDATGDLLCVWPSELVLTLEDDGARFSIEVTADRDFDVTLPGGPGAWPTGVRVDGREAPVASQNDVPFVYVSAGHSRIEGRIPWETVPETLAVPDDVARIVIVQGNSRTIASRGTDGDVWLRAPDSAPATEADTAALEVHRRLIDGSPLELITRVTLRVAGSPRELALGNVLPDGAVPVEVTSEIPTRMSPAGDLTLQIRAGTHHVEVRAYVSSPEAVLSRPTLAPPWPEQEVWVWSPNEAFRQVEVSGAPTIDPEATTLPSEWRADAAFLLDAASALTLGTTRRGEPTPPPNRLNLERDVWLDFDGDGASIRDDIRLELHQGFRLELLDGVLGRVRVNDTDQIITRAAEEGAAGVEIRSSSSTVNGEWRLEGPVSTLPAVGWSEDAQSSVTTLHLPPGWELMHASGVDQAPGTWVAVWTLLGFFALLLITIGVGRVFGLAWGVAAFVGIGLSYHEDNAPIWIWLVLAALAALHHVLGQRAFERWVRVAYLVVGLAAVLSTVPFATRQLRNAHYPILDDSRGGDVYRGIEEETPEWLADDMEGGTGTRNRYGIEGPYEAEDVSMARGAASEAGVLGSLSGSWNSPTSPYGGGSFAGNANWLDPTAVVQTGFGMPAWQWITYDLRFEGPVTRDNRITLWLAPPILTRFVSFLRAALMLGLLVVVILRRPRAPGAPAGAAPSGIGPKGAEPSRAAAATGASLAVVVFALASVSHAQPDVAIPSSEVLADLGERLTRAPLCGDHCAEPGAMTLRAEAETLVVELEVSVAAPSIYPLPGPVETWAPERVLLDGRPADALVRLESGFVYVRLSAGTHTLRIEGSLDRRDALTLSLGRAPRSLEIVSEGWEATGGGTAERVSDSIVLHRSIPRAPDGPEGAPSSGTVHADLPAWVLVERTLDIGVRWTVTTTVTRRSPIGTPAVVRIPLLAGESVTDATVVARDGFAVVTLAQNENTVSWTSVLEATTPEIVLTAPVAGRLSEVWNLSCSPLWHCDSSGLSPTTSAAGSSGLWAPRFDPWPGETLTVTLARPHPIEGRSTTIDSALLSVSPGSRLTESSLALSVRTSVSAPLNVTLPAGADVRSLSVDGGARPIQLVDGVLTATLSPGSHEVRLEWQEPTGIETFYSTPAVSLGDAAVNLTLNVEYSSDRWVLYIGGPAWGPAVLFWPYFVMVLAVAFGLSRRRTLLPKAYEWALLALGLTQVTPFTALFVVGWFFVLEWRRLDSLPGWFRFDVRQLLIAGYTLAWCFALVDAVQGGLLGTPGMDIEGPDTYGTHLSFFVDRTDGALPTATLISAPVWVFRALMFLWAAWLAFALVRWARAGWGIVAAGDLWRSRQSAAATGGPPAAAANATTTVVGSSESDGESAAHDDDASNPMESPRPTSETDASDDPPGEA